MAVRAIPEGFHTVNPFLAARDPRQLLDFLTKGMGGYVNEQLTTPESKLVHASVQIGDSMVMLGDMNEGQPQLTGMLYIYVQNADAVFNQAKAAGGQVVMDLMDQFWGDRAGALRDPAGNIWWIATHIEDVADDEMMKRHARAMEQMQGGQHGGSH